MKKKIAIFGAGGFGREVLELIYQINAANGHDIWEITGFLDRLEPGTQINGVPVLGDVDYLNQTKEELNVVLAIGSPQTKQRIVSQITNPLIKYPVLIHPSVVMPTDKSLCNIAEGTIICAFNFISSNIKVGRHVLLNVTCTLGHDATVGDFSSFMPSVNISGEVNIGQRVYGGVGAQIINKVNIADDVTIGAGSVVLKDVGPNCTVMGVPARVVIKN